MTLGSGTTRLRVGVSTTTGRYREHNEDNFYVQGVGTIHAINPSIGSPSESQVAANNGQKDTPANSTSESLFIVADGMGGQLAGEQASKLAVELIPKELRSRLESDADDRKVQSAIRTAVAAANQEIIAQSHVMPEYTNMGTTVVLALFRRDRAYVAGIGDSRVYRLRDRELRKLTQDHDLATALITAGTIRPEEAENHRFRNVLYLYLGSPDAREGPDDVRVIDVQPGDRFLLASDGLTGVVKDSVLADLLGREVDAQASAQALVQYAIASDSRDNVTCVVIHAE
jgi:PPM family protein phosphatase